jgi:cytochrome c oxidase cbb3-type subunit 3
MRDLLPRPGRRGTPADGPPRRGPPLAALAAALAITAAGQMGCSRWRAAASEGAATVGSSSESVGAGSASTVAERSVVNQPLGPVPGVGDIAPVDNPLGTDRAVLEAGRRLFVQYNCSGCHGGRAGGGMGPSLRDPSWLYGSTADRIFNSVAQGRGHGMPAWGGRVPERQIWELTAYIQSLRTPDEPERPR